MGVNTTQGAHTPWSTCMLHLLSATQRALHVVSKPHLAASATGTALSGGRRSGHAMQQQQQQLEQQRDEQQQDDPQPPPPLSQLSFKRPADPTSPTRALHLGGWGPALGLSHAQLAGLFHGLAPQQLFATGPDSSCMFAVFADERQAAAAHQALQQEDGSSRTGGRKVVVTFSELVTKAPKGAPHPPRPPVARTAAQLGVPGLQLLHDFISEREEQQLLAAAAAGEWVGLAKRRVQHHGWEFDYATRSFSRQLGPLPAWAQPVARRAGAVPGVAQVFDQLTVNEYEPGVGLAPHIDTHEAFTGAIVSLSLGSDCVMELRRGDQARPLLLPRRSLLVLAGESRYAWQHYIPSRKVDELGPEPTSSTSNAAAAPLAHADGIPSPTLATPPPPPPRPPVPHLELAPPPAVGEPAASQPAALPSSGQEPLAITYLADGARRQRRGAKRREGAARPAGAGADEQQQPQQQERVEEQQGDVRPVRLERGTRVSLTMRTIRGYACDCAWPEHCDSRKGGPLPTRLAAARAHGDAPPPPPPTAPGAANHGDGMPSLHQQQHHQDAAAKAAVEAAAAERDVHPGVGLAATGGPAAQQAGPRDGPAASQLQEGGASGAAGDAGEEEGEMVEEEEGGGDRQAERLEAAHVHAVYDAIAPHFSSTRFAIWPKVRQFIASLPPGAAVADVGCGNGKYFGVRPDVYVLGSDRSAGLVEVAHRRLRPVTPPGARPLLADVLQADGLRLPYRARCADGALCIAVLHHMSSVARRLRLLRQLLRALRPGGRALVTVWALEQEEPHKTLHKWTRIVDAPPPPSSSSSSPAPPSADNVGGDHGDGDDAARGRGAAIGAGGPLPPTDRAGGAEEEEEAEEKVPAHLLAAVPPGADYMVPWHVPFHEPGAATAMAKAKVAPQAPGAPPTDGGAAAAAASADRAGPSHLGGAQASAQARVVAAKGAVVFQRYYHLFERGELEALVRCLEPEGCRLVEACFDRSNWCVVFERAAA